MKSPILIGAAALVLSFQARAQAYVVNAAGGIWRQTTYMYLLNKNTNVLEDQNIGCVRVAAFQGTPEVVTDDGRLIMLSGRQWVEDKGAPPAGDFAWGSQGKFLVAQAAWNGTSDRLLYAYDPVGKKWFQLEGAGMAIAVK